LNSRRQFEGSTTTVGLRNLARGGRGFHANRAAIMRACLGPADVGLDLSGYLLDRLFTLPEGGWQAFAFTPRDWRTAAALISSRRVGLDRRILGLVLAYIASNRPAVSKLYTMSDTISARLLRLEAAELAPGTDHFSSTEAQSLFAFRVLCATHVRSAADMKRELEPRLARGGWCHSRLMYPLINLISNQRSPNDLDDFLAYFVIGDETPEELLALKLLLSDTDARDAPLAFKLYIGLMGHPYDACEMLLDHLEFAILRGELMDSGLSKALKSLAALLPGTRAERLNKLMGALPSYVADASPARNMLEAAENYGFGPAEIDILTRFISLKSFEHVHVAGSTRPLMILANMRAAEYPVPEQFQHVVSSRSAWSFIDGGRIIGALLRSIYMVDRASYDLEARDVLRLLMLYGMVNPMLASAPSAVSLLRRLAAAREIGRDVQDVERKVEIAIAEGSPLKQRLWINELQWRLRRLEDEGRIKAWLALVRSDARVRPLFLTGINWPWVEHIIEAQRLKPFRSFDGAYLLLLMEMEASSDPLRLKLVLDGLLADQGVDDIVATLLSEFGDKAPAFLRRYLTVPMLLASGLAANHFAALDTRLKAIEEGVRQLNFGPLLTKEDWEEETRLLTTELLLLNVNAGKFEVPWATFRKDELDRHKDLHAALRNINAGVNPDMLSSLVDTPKIFKNGRKVQYRYRRGSSLLYQLIVQVVEDFLDHPAFGLEVILSGRFRHNNVLQELQAALAGVEAIDVPPVSESNRRMLAQAYRPALERFIFDWCTRRMHSVSDDRPEALFDIVPTPDEMTELIAEGSMLEKFSDLIDLITVWLKGKLRAQVATASQIFVNDLRAGLSSSFESVQQSQIAIITNAYRPEDVRRINNAANTAVLRRVEELASWFDGVDTTTAERVSLVQLGHAVERLFENVIPGKWLVTEPDLASAGVSFAPGNVKVAFDLVRELAFNALKAGPLGEVRLAMRELPGSVPLTYEFENPVGGANAVDDDGYVLGHRYDNPYDALVDDRNSGRFKIAASAATLVGSDTRISWRTAQGRYAVTVALQGQGGGIR
jgi:hypothetical protein